LTIVTGVAVSLMFENSLEKSPSRGDYKESIYRRMPLLKQAKEGARVLKSRRQRSPR